MDTDKTFHKIVDQYPDILGKNPTQLMHEDRDHGEMTLAFEHLLDGLQEMDAEVNSETRQQLRRIAEALDMLDNPSGKGVYW